MAAAVDQDLFELQLVGIRRDGGWRVGSVATPLAEILTHGESIGDLRSLQPDIVFPVLHGPGGEDGALQGLLEFLQIAYVGSGVLASALCMDKFAFKQMMQVQKPDIPLVPWMAIDASRDLGKEIIETTRIKIRDQIGFPCFVKPASQGSSVGIRKVEQVDQLADALAFAARYDTCVLIEQAIVHAREIELSILGDGHRSSTIVSNPGEIVLPPGEWYDYDTKYIKDCAKLQIPCHVSPELTNHLQEIALQAFQATTCYGLARVDFLVDRSSETPYLNEINTMPGFTSISMYPKLLEYEGVGFRELVTRLCRLAVKRQQKKQTLVITR